MTSFFIIIVEQRRKRDRNNLYNVVGYSYELVEINEIKWRFISIWIFASVADTKSSTELNYTTKNASLAVRE